MAITSNSVQNNQNRSGNLNTSSARRTYRTNGGTISLREGETLKGVVSDIHGNKITISMDDGTSFTGTLPEASQYSIGQKAAFQITNLEGGTIYMRAISQSYLLGMEDTIEQALEEAGLPKSPRNLEIVRSLLMNQQSVSRESIADALQLCAKYPKADVNTVISMKRLGLPMDTATVTQLDNYQNQAHQLLYRMDSLTDSIGELLSKLAEENPAIARYAAGEAVNIALDSLPSLEEFNLASMKAMEQTAEGGTEALATGTGAAANGAAGEAADLLGSSADGIHPNGTDTLDPDGASAAIQQGQTGDAEARSPFARMRQLFSSITDRTPETAARPGGESPFIQEQTGHILSAAERSELTTLLGKFTENGKFLTSLQDGTLTAREFLTEINSRLSSFPDGSLRELLTSEGFQKILKGQFMSDWTLSPEGLKEDGSVTRLYSKMQEQLTSLTTLSQMFGTREAGADIIRTITDSQQNMEFMKLLNEQFAYMQLPMKLSQQNAHGDLYVMTRKNALRKSKDNLKVLLHLEMDSLGTLDVHITKEQTNISTRFFVAKDSARKLLEKNADLLKNAINEQGYSFSSEFVKKEKDIDLIHDFMEQEAPAPIGNIKRYNFDLRA